MRYKISRIVYHIPRGQRADTRGEPKGQKHWHEHHGVSNHRQLDCLFNSLFMLTTKKTSRLCICLAWQRWGPCHDVIESIKTTSMENVSTGVIMACQKCTHVHAIIIIISSLIYNQLSEFVAIKVFILVCSFIFIKLTSALNMRHWTCQYTDIKLILS